MLELGGDEARRDEVEAGLAEREKLEASGLLLGTDRLVDRLKGIPPPPVPTQKEEAAKARAKGKARRAPKKRPAAAIAEAPAGPPPKRSPAAGSGARLSPAAQQVLAKCEVGNPGSLPRDASRVRIKTLCQRGATIWQLRDLQEECAICQVTSALASDGAAAAEVLKELWLAGYDAPQLNTVKASKPFSRD